MTRPSPGGAPAGVPGDIERLCGSTDVAHDQAPDRGRDVAHDAGHDVAHDVGDDVVLDVGRAPLAEVLGPLPLWALLAVVVAGCAAASADATTRVLALAPLEVLAGIVVLLAGALLGMGLWGLLSSARYRLTGVAGLAAVVLVASTVLVGTALRDEASRGGLLHHLAVQGGRAHLEATVVAEPRPVTDGWHVLVRVDRVDGVAVRERAALQLPADPPPLGQRWSLAATARPLPDGGYGGWLASQHARVVLDPVAIRPLDPAGPAARATEWWRERIRTAATRHLDARTGGLLIGFVTGDRRVLPVADQEAMRATSLSHLTAVSGSNVAIVIAGVVALAGLLRLGPGMQRLLVLAVVPGFAFLTRLEPSVLRAGTMALLVLLAGVRGHARDARHALAAAVLVLVLLDPRLAGSLGLVLSATATAGVLVVAPALRERLPDALPRRLSTLLSITLGAQIAVLPVLLATFGELAVASVPANLLAVPAAVVAATIAFLASAVALVSVEVAAWGFALAGPGAALVLTVADRLQDVGGAISVSRPASVLAAAAGMVVLLAGARGRWRRGAALVLVVCLLLVAVPLVRGSLPAPGFQVTAIDVGQGDAFLVESPGARVLVDAGADERAARWLRQHGRRDLDLVIVTHPHADHLGGVPEVLDRLRVATVWVSSLPTDLAAAEELRAIASAQGIPVRSPVRGEAAELGDLRIEVLHPPPGRPYRHARSELNETSLVLRISRDGARVLLPGDVEREGQAELLTAAPDRLPAEVLAVPHHGSHTTDPGFLAVVDPDIALISVGRDNRHGHPHAGILEVLADLGARVVRTDRDGSVTVDVPAPADAGRDLDRDAPATSVGSAHGRPPARRRRRPPAPAGGGPSHRRPDRRGPGAQRRPVRRRRARAPPGAEDLVAVRRADLHRAARRRGVGR